MITDVVDDDIEYKREKKKQQHNYSKGKDKEIMQKVVDNWLNKKGDYFDKKGKARTKYEFANHLGIPPKTLRNYISHNHG